MIFPQSFHRSASFLVKPSTPEILKATPTNNRDGIGIYVKWKEPDDDVRVIKYAHRIRYRKNDVVSKWKVIGILKAISTQTTERRQLKFTTHARYISV